MFFDEARSSASKVSRFGVRVVGCYVLFPSIFVGLRMAIMIFFKHDRFVSKDLSDSPLENVVSAVRRVRIATPLEHLGAQGLHQACCVGSTAQSFVAV